MIKKEKVQQFLTHFCGTDFNSSAIELQGKLEELGCEYILIGNEVCPTTNRPHLQFYCQLKQKKRFRTIANRLGCHIEAVKGTVESNIDYCKKDGDYIELGQPRNLKDPNNKSDQYQDMIKLASQSKFEDIIEKYPQYVANKGLRNMKEINSTLNRQTCIKENMMCLWIYSKKTGVGKSRWTKEHFPGAYWKNPGKWFDGYEGEDVIVFDEFRPSHEHCLDRLLRWTDIYPCVGEIKGGSVNLKHTKFIITSNFHPYQIWRESDAQPLLRRMLVVEVLERDNQDGDVKCIIEGRQDNGNFIDKMILPVMLYIFLINFCTF